MSSLTKKFTVAWQDVNARGEIKTAALSNMLQEMAWLHAEQIGVGYDKLFKEGMAWVISRFRLKILQAPGWLDEISIKTWPSGLNKFFANREFQVYDAAGEIIALASSAWLIIDFNSRRLMKPEVLYSLEDAYEPDRPFEEDLQKLHPPQEAREMGTYPVLFSDLDKNQHVINTKYIEKSIDALYQLTDVKEVHEIFMDYQHETMKGDSLQLFTSFEDGIFCCQGVNSKGKTAYIAHINYE